MFFQKRDCLLYFWKCLDPAIQKFAINLLVCNVDMLSLIIASILKLTLLFPFWEMILGLRRIFKGYENLLDLRFGFRVKKYTGIPRSLLHILIFLWGCDYPKSVANFMSSDITKEVIWRATQLLYPHIHQNKIDTNSKPRIQLTLSRVRYVLKICFYHHLSNHHIHTHTHTHTYPKKNRGVI